MQPRPRVQVRDAQPVALRPAAAPVDTFTKPVSPGESALGQLARGLSEITPSLGRFSNAYEADAKDKEHTRAMDAVGKAQASAKTYKDAVDQGFIKKAENPWFQAYAQELFGRNAADVHAAGLTGFIAENYSKSTNPADFDKAVTEYNTAHPPEPTDEQHFANGFAPRMSAHIANQRSEFASAAGARLGKYADDAFHATIITGAEDIMAKGGSAADIGAAWNREVQTAAQVRGTKDLTSLNAALTVAARDLQLAHPHEHGLMQSVLDAVPTPGGKYSKTATAMQAIHETEQQLAGESAQADSAANARETHTRQEAARSVEHDLVDFLSKTSHPDTARITGFENRMKEIDPSRVALLGQIRGALADQRYPEDETVVGHAFESVYTKALGDSGFFTMEDAGHLLATRQIKLGNYRALVTEIQQRDALGGEGKLAHDPQRVAGEKDARGMFASDALGYKENNVNLTKARRAASQWNVEFAQWKAGHPTASIAEFESFKQGTLDNIYARFGERSGITEQVGIPRAQTEVRADWNLHPVTDKSNIAAITAELPEFERTSDPAKLSDETMHVLVASGVPLDLKSIKAFLVAQQRLIDSQKH